MNTTFGTGLIRKWVSTRKLEQSSGATPYAQLHFCSKIGVDYVSGSNGVLHQPDPMEEEDDPADMSTWNVRELKHFVARNGIHENDMPIEKAELAQLAQQLANSNREPNRPKSQKRHRPCEGQPPQYEGVGLAPQAVASEGEAELVHKQEVGCLVM